MGLIGTLKDVLQDLATALAGESGWLNEKLNAIAINKLASAGRTRPHPWSTRFDYICWAGLTDRTYSARLLPIDPDPHPMPDVDRVAALFVADGPQQLCRKSTCLFPAFAQYLTDGFIRTQVSNDPSKEDRRRTTSNHEIDQSPLYGRNEMQTGVLRLFSNATGRKGRLKSQDIGGEEYSPFLFDGPIVKQEFCDQKGQSVLDLPLGSSGNVARRDTLFAAGGDRVNAAPQVAMMNTLFLREHNRLAGVLERHNSGWDDERVFQTARNVMIVMFIKLVVEEYINHINTEKFKVRALPDSAWGAEWNRPNWITAEFSLLYRWHSLVPRTMVWNGKPLGPKDTSLNNSVLIERGLANAFIDVSSNQATALGLGNSAEFLLEAEKKAVIQARINTIQRYNDYREAVGLSRAKDFDDITGKPKDGRDETERARRTRMQVMLRDVYKTPDRVEFYPGLFAESRSTNGPLPKLLQTMVAMDAFSQAMTNPLLSRHIWGNKDVRRETFTKEGLDEIEATRTLRDVLARNSTGLGDAFVGMTLPGWKRL